MIEIILGIIIIVLIVGHVYTIKLMQEQIKSLAKMAKSKDINEYIASEIVEKDKEEPVQDEYVSTSQLSDEEFEKCVLKNSN